MRRGGRPVASYSLASFRGVLRVRDHSWCVTTFEGLIYGKIENKRVSLEISSRNKLDMARHELCSAGHGKTWPASRDCIVTPSATGTFFRGSESAARTQADGEKTNSAGTLLLRRRLRHNTRSRYEVSPQISAVATTCTQARAPRRIDRRPRNKPHEEKTYG
jgi:hypothetical protein